MYVLECSKRATDQLERRIQEKNILGNLILSIQNAAAKTLSTESPIAIWTGTKHPFWEILIHLLSITLCKVPNKLLLLFHKHSVTVCAT